jgi:hypothetical protein
MKDNLILSTVHELTYGEVEPFLKSLQATGSQAQVHFFTCRVSAKSLEKIKSHGVVIHPFNYLTFRRRQPLLVFWPLWKRMLASRDFAGKRRLARKIFHLMSLRFVMYYDFLESRADQFQQVLLTDCRDVYFQRDPFSENLGPGLHCFLEAQSQIIGTCPSNRKMILGAFGPKVLEEIGANTVSCAGTTIGDVDSILAYMQAMIETLCLGVKMYSGNDQGVHNYLIRRGLLPTLHLHDNYSSSVFTAGCEAKGSVLVNDRDEVIRKDGGVYPILHQQDRHPEIQRKLLAKLAIA